MVRSDAVRSRARILDAARGCEGAELRLNEVAHRAGVGVGTVYRHFPTVDALAAALAEGALERLRELAREAEADPDPGAALARLVRGALALQVDDPGLQTALMADPSDIPELAALRAEVGEVGERVFARAQAAGVVRAELTLGSLQRLICGLEHAVRLGDADDRELYLDMLLAGIRP
ncbi:TetR/AcrR family transcriptional regulator [Protaetiibacter intestinalis]|uniref:TetR family transcriptional regulator n=1 Tax=Protaetiibacter intestinalis TaxID=2419774 RepID=A0A387B892_9MICO|nr:TetR family transcriptional regulator [Protaetiibacter intestinalis]AYF98041.1 TetR family transcriptional regulator [Protaetiibacter intestinalis]